MAKKSKPTVNIALLADIAKAMAAGVQYFISQVDGMPLLQHVPPLIEVNTEVVQGDKALTRLTEAGMQMAKEPNKTTEAVTSTTYAIVNAGAPPPSKRGNRGGAGAPVQYPFEQLEIGQSFFVPATEKRPDPAKSLGSSVSAAKMKYAQETGQTKEVERTKRGKKNKAVLDEQGNKVKEKATVKVYTFIRNFVVRPVEAGKQYDKWVAPSNGALVYRVAVE